MRYSIAQLSVVLTLAGCAPEVELTSGSPIGSVDAPVILPAPITSGNLVVSHDGKLAVLTDAARDTVWGVSVPGARVSTHVVLPRGSAPAMVIEDGDGNLRAVLRGTGQLATLSRHSLAVIDLIPVCPAPRGAAVGPDGHSVLVACASGELVKVDSAGRTTSTFIAPDLRDVVVTKDGAFVTTFRNPSFIGVEGNQSHLFAPFATTRKFDLVKNFDKHMVPAVAWRSVPVGDGSIAMVHQLEVDTELDPRFVSPGSTSATTATPTPPPASTTVPAYYRPRTGPCETAVVRSEISIARPGSILTFDLNGALPVDLAISPDGKRFAVAMPGSQSVQYDLLDRLAFDVCPPPSAAPNVDLASGTTDSFMGQAVAVAFTPENTLVVASRDPLRVRIERVGSEPTLATWDVVDLADKTSETPGSRLFHNAPRGVACASCHPEAGDDGHVWKIAGKDRRTMTLSGGVMDTLPFHWSGDLRDMNALLGDTFVARMGGKLPTRFDEPSLGEFLQNVPAPKTTPGDEVSVARGHDLFIARGCAGCHAGATMTMSANQDVGTGEGPLQVPSLRGVASRGPWIHTGCAKTLEQRFTDASCGGTKHGNTSDLTTEEISSLVDYLKTL